MESFTKKTKEFCILSLAALSLCACSSVAITGRKQLNLISNQEVLALSDQSYSQYMATAKPITYTTDARMVSRCGEKIKNAVISYFKSQGQTNLLNGYKWSFVLVDDPSANAFCLPGGKVVVNQGILRYTKTETGLAVVIGHEIAHAVAKHANERLSQQVLVNQGGNILNSIISNKSQTTQNIVSQTYALGAQYGIMLPYSRTHEYEADYLGTVFMAIAGYNPDEALSFWKRMGDGKTTSIPEFMSTHPSDAKRVAKLQAALPQIKAKYYR